MANISINNDRSYCTPAEAIAAVGMDEIASWMHDETREAVHADLAPCTEEEFLAEYLRRAPYDLIIG